MPRRTRRWTLLAVGLLALTVGLAPLLPDVVPARCRRSVRRRAPPRRPAAPRGDVSGRGEVTPTMRREIERVVAAGRALGPDSGRVTTATLVTPRSGARLLRAALLPRRGLDRRTEAEVRERVAVAATVVGRRPPLETTGDLDVLATLRTSAAGPKPARVAAERAELTDAAASVAKVWLLRHELQGVPLPAGFLDDHPEAIASDADVHAAGQAEEAGPALPRKAKIMQRRAGPTRRTTAGGAAPPRCR